MISSPVSWLPRKLDSLASATLSLGLAPVRDQGVRHGPVLQRPGDSDIALLLQERDEVVDEVRLQRFVVDGAFIWTPSHDQRPRSSSTAGAGNRYPGTPRRLPASGILRLPESLSRTEAFEAPIEAGDQDRGREGSGGGTAPDSEGAHRGGSGA